MPHKARKNKQTHQTDHPKQTNKQGSPNKLTSIQTRLIGTNKDMHMPASRHISKLTGTQTCLMGQTRKHKCPAGGHARTKKWTHKQRHPNKLTDLQTRLTGTKKRTHTPMPPAS